MNTDPTFSPAVRTGVYVSGVIVAFLSFVVSGAAVALGADPAIAVIAGLIGTGWAGVSSAFGVAYRPTKG